MKNIIPILLLFVIGCGTTPDTDLTSADLTNADLTDADSNQEITIEVVPLTIEIEEEKPIGEPARERSGIVHVKFKSADEYSVGTGFFVVHNNKKYFLTAAHNVELSLRVSFFRNSGPIDVKILKHVINEEYDVAAFLVETNEKCFELEDPSIFNNIPDFGELIKENNPYIPVDVEMFGYPSEWHFRKVDGKIYQTIFDGKLLVSTGVCDNGMSGGPWFNKKTGKVVAIHSNRLMSTSSGGVNLKNIIEVLNGIETK